MMDTSPSHQPVSETQLEIADGIAVTEKGMEGFCLQRVTLGETVLFISAQLDSPPVVDSRNILKITLI